MKIKVSDLKPNPYRNLEKYKIDPYKVDALVISIKETSFWDNILARPWNDFYQLAYGHHRLLAIQKVGLKTIDVPIRELDDATMIQIMANENMEQWGSNPTVIKESVRVAKKFLDRELTKYNTIEKMRKSHLIKLLDVKREQEYQKLRTVGSGQTTILKFLGGNWKQHMIQEALVQLRESKEMQEAEEVFETQSEAQEFRKTIKKLEEKEKIRIPEKKKKEVAKQVAQTRKETKGKKKKGEKTDRHDYRRDIKVETRMAVEGISEKEAKLKDIELEFKRFDERVRSAYIGSRDLNIILAELEIEKLEGLRALFTLDNVSDLLRELKKTLTFFGYDYKNLQIGGK